MQASQASQARPVDNARSAQRMDQAALPFSPEDLARRRRRSIALAVLLVVVVVLFFITTLVRLGGTVAERML